MQDTNTAGWDYTTEPRTPKGHNLPGQSSIRSQVGRQCFMHARPHPCMIPSSHTSSHEHVRFVHQDVSMCTLSSSLQCSSALTLVTLHAVLPARDRAGRGQAAAGADGGGHWGPVLRPHDAPHVHRHQRAAHDHRLARPALRVRAHMQEPNLAASHA